MYSFKNFVLFIGSYVCISYGMENKQISIYSSFLNKYEQMTLILGNINSHQELLLIPNHPDRHEHEKKFIEYMAMLRENIQNIETLLEKLKSHKLNEKIKETIYYFAKR